MTRLIQASGVFLALLLAACGGSNGDAPPVTIAPPPPPPTVPAITTAAAFTNLSFIQPLAMRQAPGDGSRWFVVEKNGAVRVFANDPATATSDAFIDISARVNPSGEGGLLGIAFHPGFPATPYVFLSYTRTSSPLVSYVSRFTSPDNGVTLDPGTEQVLFTVEQPFDNHNGGDLAFGPDGLLYASFGDGGSGGDPLGNGQNTSTLPGSIVRIDVDSASPFNIPPGNPFAGNALCTQGVGAAPCPEIFAWGFRNPWRISFDPVTGKLWTGDVGQGSWEEVDVVNSGQNYGWDVREGAHCHEPATGCAATTIDPIAEYPRGGGGSVTGGYVYRGSDVADLVGWYVFGDFVTGTLYAVPEDSPIGTAPETMDQTGLSIASFGQDLNGEIYIVHFGGSLHRVTGAP
ncbi:MAG: PQQ-dependent sugar dehydrogenase [Gammaproteobacteria bacterium]|nr:PQQ-dependent sugar dehydrogenase [Gammaproteobacteria bacterium]